MSSLDTFLRLVEGSVCCTFLYVFLYLAIKWDDLPKGSRFRLFESAVVGVAILVTHASIQEMCAVACIAGAVRATAQRQILQLIMRGVFGGIMGVLGLGRALPLIVFILPTHAFWLLAKLNLPGLGLTLMVLCCTSLYSIKYGMDIILDAESSETEAMFVGIFTAFIPIWLAKAFVSTKIDSVDIERLEGIV